MSTAPLPDMMQSFLDEAWESVVVFGQTAEFLGSGHAEALAVMAHRLKGSAGLYGFPQTSRLAALMERILQGADLYTPNQRLQATEFMAQGTAVLTEALDTIAATGKESQVGLELGRLGAAELIQELAFANPEAFRDRGPEGARAHEPAAEQSGVTEELKRFFRENADFWEFFAPETNEHLEFASQSLAAMGNGDPDGAHLQALFRAMHTVKGAAYSVGCKPVGEIAHRLEDLLVEVREGRKAWEPSMVGIFAEGGGVIGAMLAVAEGKHPNPYALPGKLHALETRLAQALGQEAPRAPVIEAQPAPAGLEVKPKPALPTPHPGTRNPEPGTRPPTRFGARQPGPPGCPLEPRGRDPHHPLPLRAAGEALRGA